MSKTENMEVRSKNVLLDCIQTQVTISLKQTDTYIYMHTHTYLYMLLLFFICSVVSDFLWPHGLQHTRLPCPSASPRACSNSCPLSQQCHPTISSSSPPSPPPLNLSQHQGLFQWVGLSQKVAKGLELQLQHQSFQRIFRADFL